MLLLAQPQQSGAQQRASRQIEPALRFLDQAARNTVFLFRPLMCAKINQRQSLKWRGADVLDRLAILIPKHRLENLMPPDNRSQALVERLRIQRSGQAPGKREIVRNAFRLRLLNEPEPLLGPGQRQRRPARNRTQRRRLILKFKAAPECRPEITIASRARHLRSTLRWIAIVHILERPAALSGTT